MNRHLTAAQIYEGIMSRNAYSAFENGNSDTNSANLLALIARLGIKYEELGAMLDTSDADELSVRSFDYRNQVVAAYSKQDSDKLRQLLETVQIEYQLTNYIRYWHIILWIQGYQSNFDRESPAAVEMRQYLFTVEHWYSYEYVMLSFFTWTFDSQGAFELRNSILTQASAINTRRKDIQATYQNLANILRMQIIDKNYANAHVMLDELFALKYPNYDVFPYLSLELYGAMLEYYEDSHHNTDRLLKHKTLIETLQQLGSMPFAPVLLRDLETALAYQDGSHLAM
nr:Rgg/GadR/MutR family transcriptional regulator [Periweissella cryptocerci]